MDATTLAIIIAAKDEASAALLRVDESLAALGKAAQEAAIKTDAALGEMDAGFAGVQDAAAKTAAVNEASMAKTAAAQEESASRQFLASQMVVQKSKESEDQFKKTAATAALVGGAAALFVGGMAVKAAGDFQQQLTRLVTSAGETHANLKLVGDGIIDISNQTGTSAKALNDAMYIIESGGNHGAAGLQVLKAAAQGAKAENSDLATVANAVTSVMQDYHLKSSDAAMITSKLVTAVGAGKTTFNEFTGAMSAVLPTASAAHISLDDVTGSIAAMTVHGMSAQQASENMADAIRHLQNPTQVMTKNLSQVGITASDLATKLGKEGVSGTMQDISKAILEHMGPDGKVLLNAFNQSKTAADDVNRAISAMPASLQGLAKSYKSGTMSLADYRAAVKELPTDQAALMQQFASMENRAKGFSDSLKGGLQQNKTYGATLASVTGDAATFNTALMLTGENADYTNNAVKKVGAAHTEAGNNVKGWTEIQGTFNQKMSIAHESFKNVGITLGTVLLPTVTAVMNGVVAFLKPIATWIENNQKLAVVIGAVIVALAAGIGTFLAIGKAVNMIKDAYKAWGEVMKLVNMIGSASPMILILMALIVVVILVVTHWKEVKKWGEEAWHGIEAAWSACVKFFDKILQDVVGFFKKHWKIILDIVLGPIAIIITNWGAISRFFDQLWQDIVAVFKKMAGYIVQFFKDEWDGMVIIWNAVGGFFSGLWNGIKKAIGAFGGLIKNFFQDEWNGLKNIFGGIGDFFSGLWGDIKRSTGVIGGIISAPFKDAFNGVARLWNDSIGKLSFTAPSWVPGFGGKGFTMPKLPYLEAGSPYFGGGTVVVGEKGPEVITLPQGASVTPNAVASHAGGVGGDAPLVGTLQVNIKAGALMGNQAEAQEFATMIYQQFQQIARRHNLQQNVPNIGILPV